jgi:hypothetical protein
VRAVPKRGCACAACGRCVVGAWVVLGSCVGCVVALRGVRVGGGCVLIVRVVLSVRGLWHLRMGFAQALRGLRVGCAWAVCGLCAVGRVRGLCVGSM